MELKHIVGIVVVSIICILLFTAGGKNDYKKKRELFPLCLPIPFIGHEICIRAHTPKSSTISPVKRANRREATRSKATRSGSTKSGTNRREDNRRGARALATLKNKHTSFHKKGVTGKKHKELHEDIAKEHKKKLHKGLHK